MSEHDKYNLALYVETKNQRPNREKGGKKMEILTIFLFVCFR